MATKKEKILVVEDEGSVQSMISEMLSRAGYEVVTANHGKEALGILRKEAFSLALTDVQMPEMDGLEFLKAAQAEFPGLTIIVMTAQEAGEMAPSLLASEAADVISKPFTADELRTRLIRVLREKHRIEELTQKRVELEIANEELRRLDQLKASFVSNISDELQTPVTVIKEFIALMLKGQVGTLTDDQREYLGIANKNTLRLTNLIEKLLDFSRIEAGKGLKLKYKPTRLTEVVEDAVMALSQQADEKRIRLENHIDPDTPLVLVDRSRMMEVFVNLIGNGIKFTPTGGQVGIDAKGLTEGRNFLKVVVTDTGVGIAPEDLPRIFDRFYQGQRIQEGSTKGTGLGLAITKEIIEGHQGTIQAENRGGGGTSVVFTLPLFGIPTIFDLMVHPMLNEAEQDGLPLSLIQVEFWNQQTKREAVLTREVWETLVCAVQKMVRSVDTVIPFQESKIYIFTFNDKKLAKEIGKRVQGKVIYNNYVPKKTDVQFKTFTHPQEAPTKEDFLKGCHQLIKED
jgi:signal transduction histidine kinase